METVERPERPPDYVAGYGSAYWFREMIYMSAHGHVARIAFNEEQGRLYMMTSDGQYARDFAADIKDKYLYWLHGEFDAIVLGSKDE